MGCWENLETWGPTEREKKKKKKKKEESGPKYLEPLTKTTKTKELTH